MTRRLSGSKAYLAAETGDWAVFLRAHLDIAVDPYGTNPSQSEFRTCFLQELEELDIRAEDLLLADLLASPWIDPGFESARLLGKALAFEIKDRRGFEDKVLQLIADKKLDDLHRLSLHYLFLNYVTFLKDATERDRNMSRLRRAEVTIPDYLSVTVKE